ncbi:MAG: hypothetical protein WC219_01285 [Acholeplasmataceae bacterium]
MNKKVKLITNIIMLLVLFFVLLYQSFNILSLSITFSPSIVMDIIFYFILFIALAIIILFIYYLPIWLVFEISTIHINLTSLKLKYSKKIYIIQPFLTNKHIQLFKSFKVIRC